MSKKTRGVGFNQMRNQERRVAESQASRQDREIREAANDFANQLKERNAGDKYYDNPENLEQAWNEFQHFLLATAERRKGRRALLPAGAGSKRLGAFLLALTVLDLITGTSANILQQKFENGSLDSVGSSGSRGHGNLRGTAKGKDGSGNGYAVATARTIPASVASLSAPAMPSVPRDPLAAMERDDASSPRKEKSAKKRVLTHEEIEQIKQNTANLGDRVTEFKEANPGKKIPIATLAKAAGFRTFKEEREEEYGEDYNNYGEMDNANEVNLEGASFSGLDLSNANFENTNLRDVSFYQCNLARADFKGIEFLGNNCYFRQCDLSQANLAMNKEYSYSKVYIIDSNCNGATFEGRKGQILVGSAIEGGSDFRDTNWRNTDITFRVSNPYGYQLPDDAEHRPDFEGASWDGARLRFEMSDSTRPNALARNLRFDNAAQITSVTYPRGVYYNSPIGSWDDGMEETTHSLAGERVIHDDSLTPGATVVQAASGNNTGLVGLISDPALCSGVTQVPAGDFHRPTGRSGAGTYVHPSAISQPQLAAFTDALSTLFTRLRVNADIINLDALKAELANAATTPERAAGINKILEKFTKELGRDETLTDIENVCGGSSGRDGPLYIAPAVFPAEPGATSTLVVNNDVKIFLRTFFARIGFHSDMLDRVIDNGDAQRVLQAIYGRREVAIAPRVEGSASAAGSDPSAETPPSSRANVGAIVGGTVGGLALLICCCVVACCCCGDDRNRRPQAGVVQAGAAAGDGRPAVDVAATQADTVAVAGDLVRV